MQPEIRVRRVYEPPEPQDGSRVLVDRLWPRGLRKDAAALDEWGLPARCGPECIPQAGLAELGMARTRIEPSDRAIVTGDVDA